ncbi:hypothetical protein HRR75_002831 [Exophiala dermatitidis]|nr:hypothetical protein HRR75_002831 [Exophiala dermatitidis]
MADPENATPITDTETVNGLEKSIETLQAFISEIQAFTDSPQHDYVLALGPRELYISELTNAKSNMSAALRLLDELKIRLSEAQTKHHELTEELGRMKSEIEQLAKSEDNAQKAAEQSAAGLTIVEGQLANAKDEIAQSTATRSHLASELQSLKDKAASEVIKFQQELANQKRDYQALTERYSEQSQTVAAVRGELKGLQHSIATLQNQLTSNEQVTKQQKEQHERLTQQQRQEYEQQRQEHEEHKTTLRERVEDLQELLRVEKDAGVGRTQRTVNFRLHQQKIANEAAREQLRRELEHEHNRNIAALGARLQESRDSEQQMLRDHAVALAEQHDIHEEVKIELEAKLTEMRDSRKQVKAIMAQNHLQALTVKEDDHKKAVAALTSQWEKRSAREAEESHENGRAEGLKQLLQSMQVALSSITKIHDIKLQAQKTKLEKELDGKLRSREQSLQNEWEGKLNSEKQSLQNESEAKQQALQTDWQDRLNSQLQSSQKELEGRLKFQREAMQKESEDKLIHLKQSLQDKFQTLHKAKMEEQRQHLSAEHAEQVKKLEELFQVRLNDALASRPGPSSWSAEASRRRRRNSQTGSPTQREPTHNSPVGDSSVEEPRDSSRAKRRRVQESLSPELGNSRLSNKRSRFSATTLGIHLRVQPPNSQQLKPRAKARQLRSMFYVAWDATPEEEASILSSMAQLFKNGQDLAMAIQNIDKYCIDDLSGLTFSDPPRCLFARLRKVKAGPGGPAMIREDCDYCAGTDRLCVWARYAPGVGTGYGSKVNGTIPKNGRRYNPDAQPRTVDLGGHQVRWVMKKRKEHPDDPADPLRVVGSVTV